MHKRPRHTGQANCTCPKCALIACGAVDPDWDGWPWVWLAGEARMAMMGLTRQAPVLWCGPKQTWAGEIDWFTRAGVGLVFDADEDEDDEPVA
jgi:hypothetical protein